MIRANPQGSSTRNTTGRGRALNAHPIFVYVIFTAAISSVFYFLIIKSGHMGAGLGGYVAGLMWSPGLAALLTCKYIRRDIRSLGWQWAPIRYELAGYLLPLFYAAIIYLFVWITGIGGFYRADFVALITKSFGLGPLHPWFSIALYFVFTATFSVIRGCATVLGEEIGWRGFLVPELAKQYTFTATALIAGIIWALWHYPVLVFADYNSGTPVWYYLPILTITIPLLSFVWAWLRLRSGSIWPGVLLHASHNTFIQIFFEPLTVDHGKTRYVAGEFGAALLALSALLAAYFWGRRAEVELQEADTVPTGP